MGVGVYSPFLWLACCASSLAYDCECNTDYIYVGRAGKEVAAYVDALDKEKRRTEIANELEERIANLDKERKFEYYTTLEGWHAELYKEYKSL